MHRIPFGNRRLWRAAEGFSLHKALITGTGEEMSYKQLGAGGTRGWVVSQLVPAKHQDPIDHRTRYHVVNCCPFVQQRFQYSSSFLSQTRVIQYDGLCAVAATIQIRISQASTK